MASWVLTFLIGFVWFIGLLFIVLYMISGLGKTYVDLREKRSQKLVKPCFQGEPSQEHCFSNANGGCIHPKKSIRKAACTPETCEGYWDTRPTVKSMKEWVHPDDIVENIDWYDAWVKSVINGGVRTQ